ncbi:3-oxoacyl-ACP reductase FabG [soil metagenome]
MDIDLTGDVAVVTGAGNGLGRGVAVELARHGAAVALLDRDTDGLAGTAAEIAECGGRCSSLVVDVADNDQVESTVREVQARWADPSILVTAAAIDESVDLGEMAISSWQKMIDVNLNGTFYPLKAVIPGMRRRGYGRIILFGSNIALKGGHQIAHYGAAKGAVHALTRCAALDLAGDGITVNCIAPGPIETNMLWSLPPAWLEAKKAELPVGRFGRVEEIVPTVVLLASKLSSYTTGSIVNVSGGDVLQ